MRKEKVWMKPSSFQGWFLLLLSLNIFDILTTTRTHEANPVTLHLWQHLGIPQAAALKIALVLLFGLLFPLAQKLAKPNEQALTQKVFLGLLKLLAAFYIFVILINVAVLSLI